MAAVAAMSLHDSQRMERELTLLVAEDPSNALAPSARKNLEILAHDKELRLHATNTVTPEQTTFGSNPARVQSFPNNDRLKAQLRSLDDSSDGSCITCDQVADTAVASAGP